MWKSVVTALMAAAVLSPCVARADAFDQGMDTMWEVLWHQTGTPTRLVRWEQDIKVRVFGVNLAAHKDHTLAALRSAAAEAGLKVTDVSEQADAAQQANVSIEITANDALADRQPCETRLNFRTEDKLESVTMQMRDSEEWRCAYHEVMHVMGVRGHPEGLTSGASRTTSSVTSWPMTRRSSATIRRRAGRTSGTSRTSPASARCARTSSRRSRSR